MLTDKEKVELYLEIMKVAHISYEWMLEDHKIRFDDHSNPGNYSDEIKQAMSAQKLLETALGIRPICNICKVNRSDYDTVNQCRQCRSIEGKKNYQEHK